MSDQQPLPELEDDTDYALDRDTVGDILCAVEDNDSDALSALLNPMHPADVADLMEQVGNKNRRNLLEVWGEEIDGEVISELEGDVCEEVMEAIPDEVLEEAVRELDSDDVVDILEDLEPEQRETILASLDDPDWAAVEQALSYPEFSAGRLMPREVVYAPEH